MLYSHTMFAARIVATKAGPSPAEVRLVSHPVSFSKAFKQSSEWGAVTLHTVGSSSQYKC